MRMRHQSEPFSRSAEAILVPPERYPISNDTTVSPSRRRIERSVKVIVIVHPGGVLSMSQDFSVSPVAVEPDEVPFS